MWADVGVCGSSRLVAFRSCFFFGTRVRNFISGMVTTCISSSSSLLLEAVSPVTFSVFMPGKPNGIPPPSPLPKGIIMGTGSMLPDADGQASMGTMKKAKGENPPTPLMFAGDPGKSDHLDEFESGWAGCVVTSTFLCSCALVGTVAL